MGSDAQRVLFHDSVEDAIGSAIAVLGGPKKVGSLLWPALSISAAEARVRSCLNPERDHKFAPEEVLTIAKLARAAGDHSVMQYLATELSYSITPIDPETEREKLQREIVETGKRLERMLQRLESNGRIRAVG